MSDLPDAVDRLTKRLQALEQRLESRLESLERRLDALEHPLAAHWPHPSAETEATPALAAAAAPPIAQSGSMFPVLGRAMLGIAGAYVLRAVAETSSLPRLAVACAGIAYAFLWLAWAARVRGGPAAVSIHKLALCRHFRADPCSHALGADPALQSSAGGDRGRRGFAAMRLRRWRLRHLAAPNLIVSRHATRRRCCAWPSSPRPCFRWPWRLLRTRSCRLLLCCWF